MVVAIGQIVGAHAAVVDEQLVDHDRVEIDEALIARRGPAWTRAQRPTESDLQKCEQGKWHWREFPFRLMEASPSERFGTERVCRQTCSVPEHLSALVVFSVGAPVH